MNLVLLSGVIQHVTRAKERVSLRLRVQGLGSVLVLGVAEPVEGSEVLIEGSLRGRGPRRYLIADKTVQVGLPAPVQPTRSARGSGVTVAHVARHQRQLSDGRVIWVRGYQRGANHV